MVKFKKLKRAGDSDLFSHSNIQYLKKAIRASNPFFLDFVISDFFIYEAKLCFIYLKNLDDLNKLKPNQQEISLLNKKIEELSAVDYDNSNPKQIIEVQSFIKDIFLNMKLLEPKLNEIDMKIKDIISTYENAENISIKKIRELFYKQNGYYISKTKIFNIMHRKLKYHYLKTAVKNKMLCDKKYITMNFFFLKIILRALKFDANFIFIDEAGFYISNPNYRCWRKKNQDVYNKITTKKKLNLIMGINKEKIIHYELTHENTNSKTFLNFMTNLYNKLTEEERKKAILVLDNLTAHLTGELFNFYKQKGIKTLFNTPYLSKFNMIEYCFRSLKNITYKKRYKNIKELKKDISILINDGYLERHLIKLYKETLENYLFYINDNKSINLN